MMQPILDPSSPDFSSIHESSHKRRMPSPAPEESAPDSQLLKKANVKTITLDPEILAEATSITKIDPNITTDKFLISLVKHITCEKVTAIKKRKLYDTACFDVEAGKSIIQFYITPGQEKVLNDIYSVKFEDLLSIFNSPINCWTEGRSFSFSLFSLFYSTGDHIDAFIEAIKDKSTLSYNQFLAQAALYAITPLYNNYINPNYEFLANVYFHNITKLDIKGCILCDHIHAPLVKRYFPKAKFQHYSFAKNFPFENFFVTEANDGFSKDGVGVTEYSRFLINYLKSPKVVQASSDDLSIKNDKDGTHQISGTRIQKHLRIKYLGTSKIHIGALIGIHPSRISKLGIEYLVDRNRIFITLDNSEEFYFQVTKTQEYIIFRMECPFISSNNLLDALLSNFVIYSSQNVIITRTSLLMLLFLDTDATRSLVTYILNKCNLDVPETFIGACAHFALSPLNAKILPFLNPSYFTNLPFFYENLKRLNKGSILFPTTGEDKEITLESTTWKLVKGDTLASPINRYYAEAEAIMGSLACINTEHVSKWTLFRSRINEIPNPDPSIFSFEYQGKRYDYRACVANTDIFNLITDMPPEEVLSEPSSRNADQTAQKSPKRDEENLEFISLTEFLVDALQNVETKDIETDFPQFQSPEAVALLGRLKALTAPIADELNSFEINSNAVEIKSNLGSLRLYPDQDQLSILKGIVPDGLNIQSFIKPISVYYSSGLIVQTCLLALFYEKSDFNDHLIETLKPQISIAFMAEAAYYAFWPEFPEAGKELKQYLRPNFSEKTGILLENLNALNGNKNIFPYRVASLLRLNSGKKTWSLAPSKIAVYSVNYNLYRQEALVCALITKEFTVNSHTQIWKRFYENIESIISSDSSLVVQYMNRRVEFKGAYISEHKFFKAIVEKKDIILDEKEEAIAPLPIPQPVLPISNAVPIPASAVDPSLEYLKIANIIESFWFQNAVNYSRWIKLLRETKAVFSFEALPKELMAPLSRFKKEHVDHVLKFLGVDETLFIGDLPDEIAEKAIPTLLRVKAAEFKLLKSSLAQERTIASIHYKPCYLAKPGTRFVHIIEIAARFDQYGLISGFVLNDQEPIEKHISIHEFNLLVEEGKKKKIIVLQRETIKLVEEAPEEAPVPHVKRGREEEAKKDETERAPKEAKAESILPPVPQARVHKRPSTESTVHPKAPKESKFTDKGDITTDRPRAIGKPLDGGIIPPPDMIDKPLAPSLESALSLDDLFSALSANAGAQINHIVMSSLNHLKAIFSEEPLVYEGLELISRLEKTPLPSIPCLVPKAKKYQWDYVIEAKRREEADLGTILSPYMGLGKTWIYVSKIILGIYEGAKGHHIIITPNALRKTIEEDAQVILKNARLNAFIHLKSMKWGDWCATRIIKENTRTEKEFLLSLLGLFEEEEFDKIMMGRGPLINELITTFVGNKFSQHPSKIKRLYEYCKSTAPKDTPERGAYDQKGLERVLSFSLSNIKKCDEGKDLIRFSNDEQPHVIIATYEQAEYLAKNPKCAPGCASLTFDEAQYIHNPKTNIAQWAEALLKELNPKAKMAVTGTPIENGIEDLFQLVGLMAPKLKCPAILSTLSNLSSSASRFVKSKQPELALTHLLKFHGHMQAYLSLVSQQLTLILQKDDPRVKEAWGDGAKVEYHYEKIAVSEIAKEKYREAHELFKTRKVDPISGKKLDTNMAYYSRVASIMLDPQLQVASLTPKDPAVQRLLKWIKHEAQMSDIDQLIERSALLSAIIYSPKTEQAVQDKKVALIFVANIAVGKVIRKVLKKKFPENQGTESYLMYGDQKEEKKNLIIKTLKEEGKSKFGILSIESGSTGFSIPHAALTIMPTLSYNVATELQAIGRMDRATSTGRKDVVYPLFGIFSEEHIPVVQMIKKLTYKNFFAPAETQLERLKDMAQLIRNNIYQSYLNEKRDADLAKIEMEAIDGIIETLLCDIEEEDLKEFVKRLTPPLPKYVPQPAKVAIAAKGALPSLHASFVRPETAPPVQAIAKIPELRIPGNKHFKMPLPNDMSKEDKIRLAHFLTLHGKELAAPIKEIYEASKNPEFKTQVRERTSTAKAYQTLLNLIAEAKNHVASIEDIGIDQFKIVGQDYVLEKKEKADCSKRAKLVKGAFDVLEILI